MIMKKLVVIGLLFSMLLLSGCITTTVNGRHSGQITAIEQNGLIWKTWSVYVKSDISASQEDIYCVEDLNVVKKLQSASANREKVTLIYHDELIVAPWRCNEEIGIIDNVG